MRDELTIAQLDSANSINRYLHRLHKVQVTPRIVKISFPKMNQMHLAYRGIGDRDQCEQEQRASV